MQVSMFLFDKCLVLKLKNQIVFDPKQFLLLLPNFQIETLAL